jgi:hypothetical protein
MANASKDSVDGTKVSGATNVVGGSSGTSPIVSALADDVASVNAARANMIVPGTGTKTSKGRIYGVGAGGQTDGGY